MCACACARLRVREWVCMCVCMCAYECTCACVLMHVSVRLCLCMYVCVCTYACTCACVHVCGWYIRTHVRTHVMALQMPLSLSRDPPFTRGPAALPPWPGRSREPCVGRGVRKDWLRSGRLSAGLRESAVSKAWESRSPWNCIYCGRKRENWCLFFSYIIINPLIILFHLCVVVFLSMN